MAVDPRPDVRHTERMTTDHSQAETMKFFGDAGAAGISVGALLGALPHVTAFLSLLWVLIRLYETKTVQSILPKRFRSRNEDDARI